MYAKTNTKHPFPKWILFTGILIAIPIVIYVAIRTRYSAIEEMHQQAMDDLKVNTAYLESNIDHLYTMTRIVSTDERVQILTETPRDQRQIDIANKFLARFHNASGTFSYILDDNGIVIATCNWAEKDSFMSKDYSFRPYFKDGLKGKASQYVAVGVTSKLLGYYVSIPIRKDGRIVAVAVTKTNPQDLIMLHDRSGRPLIITDTHGVTIISDPKELLFHSLTSIPEHITKHMEHQRQFASSRIVPLGTSEIETIGKVRVITVPAHTSFNNSPEIKRFVLAGTRLRNANWNAHILYPIKHLNIKIIQSILITFLILLVTLLLILFGVQRWRYINQLHEQAIHDPLTGLYTRLYMLEAANSLLASHNRNAIDGVGAILMDLDHFKVINDRYGHGAGDEVLMEIAAVIIKECRESDIPVRYGGEEFLILVPTGDKKKILQLAERIRSKIKKLKIEYPDHVITITLSGGIATHIVDETLEKFIDRADQLLYQAKKNGRDQIVLKDT